MSRSPTATVVALSYNHERFVTEALESVAAQTYRDFELIIIDDCSSDDSVAAIEAWLGCQSEACIFIRHQANRGIPSSLNEALEATHGRYLSVLSCDDVWHSDMLEKMVAGLDQLPDDVAVLYGDAEGIDSGGRILARHHIEELSDSAAPPEGRIQLQLLSRNFIPAIAALRRTDCLKAVGGYDESLCYEDWDMWLRLAERYSFAHLPEVVAQYRHHGDSLMRSSDWVSRMSDSTRRLLLKWVGQDSTSDAVIERTAWTNAYGWMIAESLYEMGHPCAVRYADLRWHREHSPRALVGLACVRLRVPYGVFSRIARWTGRVQGTAERLLSRLSHRP